MPLLTVNHHYFRQGSTGKGIYPTTPASLRAEVGKIRAAGWRIGSEEDILAFSAGALPTNTKVCVLTFDDGLREQMEAMHLLESMDATAICYVPTAPLVSPCVLDVHKLQMIRSQVDDVELADELEKRFAFSSHPFDDDHLRIQYRYDSHLGRRVKYFLNFLLDEDVRIEWTSIYFTNLFGDERAAAQQLYMNKDDLVTLARRRAVGSHAHSHVPLANLDEHRLAEELTKSRELLRSVTGCAPVGISYPFGGKSAVNEEVFETAHRCGYAYGLTMERGFNEPTCLGSAFRMKRIDVNDLDKWLYNDDN